ncbi:MAG TPA: HIT domain-containing protein, partial [Planctomycetota bacterium]|nr:HIT domain-containing protein [Planctomycetota bacterium]
MQPPRNRLWAPWRLAYIKVARAKGCFFCVYARNQKRDAKNHVVSRGRHAFCVINRFPYNNGHLMVAPLRHTGKLESLTPEEVLGIWELTADAKRRLDRSMRPHGYN